MRFILLFILFISYSAFAAVDTATHFYAEPNVGFTTGNFKSSGDVNGVSVDVSEGMTGFTPGLYTGWRSEYIHVFLGGNYSILKTAGTDTTDSAVVNQMDYGLGFGWEWNWPGMTSVMLEKVKWTSDADGAVSLDGLGFRIAFSFFLSSNFKLNVNYSSFNTEKDDIKYTVSEFSAGISIPFDINYPNEWWRERRYGAASSAPAPSSASSSDGSNGTDDTIEPIEEDKGDDE
jgi:hypothetical protein